MTAANAQRPDPRKNDREQRGEDSCMTVAVPVLVGIGLLLLRLPPLARGKRRRPAPPEQARESGNGVTPAYGPPRAGVGVTSPP